MKDCVDTFSRKKSGKSLFEIIDYSVDHGRCFNVVVVSGDEVRLIIVIFPS